jgi:predicted DNA-binding protein
MKDMKDKPRTMPYSFRLTEKEHGKVLALADKKKWTKSDALREMIKRYK